ncbi:MAG TPA: methyltransferase [Thermofilum sp.]|nr:methyltransferase [Thermofilum sp.]
MLMEYMKPRERLITALKHDEPDRVPIDLGSMPSTGIMAVAYARLKEYFGIKGGVIRVYDTGQQLAEPEEFLLNSFHVDVIDLKRSLPPSGPDNRRWKKWVLPDGTPCEVPEWFNPEPDGGGGWILRDEKGRIVSKMPKGSLYFDGVYHPLEKARLVKEVEDYPWERHKVSDEYVQWLKRKAEYLYHNTDYAIHFFGAGSLHEWGQALRGWSTWLVDLRVRKHIANAMLENMMEVLKHNLKKYVSALEGLVQVIGFGDDLGVQVGPQISPKTYREMLKPYHEELFRYVKKHSKMFVFLHSCGSIYDLIPDLIDAGVDAINPVQISARNMEPERLKREFGEQVTFWGGGVDTQSILPFSEPEEVKEHVKRNLETFKPGGGYVFNQVHNIQAKVPPQNIVEAYKAAYEYGFYIR